MSRPEPVTLSESIWTDSGWGAEATACLAPSSLRSNGGVGLLHTGPPLSRPWEAIARAEPPNDSGERISESQLSAKRNLLELPRRPLSSWASGIRRAEAIDLKAMGAAEARTLGAKAGAP